MSLDGVAARFVWFANNGLNGVAYLGLQMLSPLRVAAFVGQIGRTYPELRSVQEVRLMAALFEGRGSCLSRSIAIAARYPGAAVVIGAAPRRAGPAKTVSPNGKRSRQALAAHAWIEVDGKQPLEGSGIATTRELARFCIRNVAS